MAGSCEPHGASDRRLRLKTYCEGDFSLAKALKERLEKETLLRQALKFVGATEFQDKEEWKAMHKKTDKSDKCIKDLQEAVTATWGVDATDRGNFTNVDIAIIGAPYADGGGETPTKTLVLGIANALDSAKVPWVVLIGRHQTGGETRYGRTALYSPLLHHSCFNEVKTCVCGESKPTSVIAGYAHKFTGRGTAIVDNGAKYGGRMFASLLQRKTDGAEFTTEKIQLTARRECKDFETAEPLISCLAELAEIIRNENVSGYTHEPASEDLTEGRARKAASSAEDPELTELTDGIQKLTVS